MAPKTAEKKPASKSVKASAQGGKKGGKKKSVESWKIYIYKVRCLKTDGAIVRHVPLPTQRS